MSAIVVASSLFPQPPSSPDPSPRRPSSSAAPAAGATLSGRCPWRLPPLWPHSASLSLPPPPPHRYRMMLLLTSLALLPVMYLMEVLLWSRRWLGGLVLFGSSGDYAICFGSGLCSVDCVCCEFGTWLYHWFLLISFIIIRFAFFGFLMRFFDWCDIGCVIVLTSCQLRNHSLWRYLVKLDPEMVLFFLENK